MAGAYGYKRDRHASAWQWLNEQDADVALLQEVVPHPEGLGPWGSVVFRRKYKQHGCAVLVKAPRGTRIFLRASRSPGAARQKCGRSNQSSPSFGRS